VSITFFTVPKKCHVLSESPLIKKKEISIVDSSLNDLLPNSYPLRIMDFIFSKDSTTFFTPNYTTVEKLGHAFHMQDVWLHSKEHYNKVRSHSFICATVLSGLLRIEGDS
jgi:hypothetical protein